MAGERRRAWLKESMPAMVRSIAADQTAPMLPSNPFYRTRLEKSALELVRRENVLKRASVINRASIERGVERAQYAYREKVILLSIKNAFRAAQIPRTRHVEISSLLQRHAALLPFISPEGRRDVDLKGKMHQKGERARRYSQANMRMAIENMYRELDVLIGLKKRRQLLHYFSLFFDGGINYRKTVAAHHRDIEADE